MLILDSYSASIESGHTIDDNDDTTETIKGAASTEGALDTLGGMGIDRMEQGAIGGLTGVALSECSQGASMRWHFYQSAQGPCKAWGLTLPLPPVLTCLDGLLPAIKLDPEPLLEEARRIEAQISEMMASSSASNRAPWAAEAHPCSVSTRKGSSGPRSFLARSGLARCLAWKEEWLHQSRLCPASRPWIVSTLMSPQQQEAKAPRH